MLTSMFVNTSMNYNEFFLTYVIVSIKRWTLLNTHNWGNLITHSNTPLLSKPHDTHIFEDDQFYEGLNVPNVFTNATRYQQNKRMQIYFEVLELRVNF